MEKTKSPIMESKVTSWQYPFKIQSKSNLPDLSIQIQFAGIYMKDMKDVWITGEDGQGVIGIRIIVIFKYRQVGKNGVIRKCKPKTVERRSRPPLSDGRTERPVTDKKFAFGVFCTTRYHNKRAEKQNYVPTCTNHAFSSSMNVISGRIPILPGYPSTP